MKSQQESHDLQLDSLKIQNSTNRFASGTLVTNATKTGQSIGPTESVDLPVSYNVFYAFGGGVGGCLLRLCDKSMMFIIFTAYAICSRVIGIANTHLLCPGVCRRARWRYTTRTRRTKYHLVRYDRITTP